MLLWVLNIGNLCSGQDFLDFYPAGDMETGVRHFQVLLAKAVETHSGVRKKEKKRKKAAVKESDPGKHSFGRHQNST